MCQGIEMWQNMPPQNIPHWPKDYFELKAIEKKNRYRKALSSLICLIVGHKFVKVLPSPLEEEKFSCFFFILTFYFKNTLTPDVCGGFHTTQFSDTSWVSYNLTQF